MIFARRCRTHSPPFVAVSAIALLVFGGCAPQEAGPPPAPAPTITNSIGMRLIRIPAGEFQMGSADADPGSRDDEKPRHRVRISRPFYMGVYEVTQGQFEQVMGANPSFFSAASLPDDAPADVDRSRYPVDGVTWHQATDFCGRLSALAAEKQAGRVYRLPTEAEWEYAARAGTTTIFHYGDSLSSRDANFNGNYPFGEAAAGPFLNRTARVGSYRPNAFGLYDMHGNLHEWCADRFDRGYYAVSPEVDPPGPARGTSRVIRGGDWYSDGRDCRSAFRYADIPDGTFYALGFRVVCDLGAPSSSATEAIAVVESRPTPPATKPSTSGSEQPRPNSGEDWPNWRGPRRDGSWQSGRLPSEWPADGLPQAWRRPLGAGYGGVAVADGRVYVMDRQQQPEDVERVVCFDALDGSTLWTHDYPVDYTDVAYGNGPRGTPTVFQGRVYTLGAVGHLLCLNAADGHVVWSQDLAADFRARIPIWGLSASPVVFEDLLIVHAGSAPDGCYQAFDLETGHQRWRSLPDAAGYATPVVIQRDDGPQLLGWTPDHVRGLDPRSGELAWSVPFVVNNGTAIADPIFHEDVALVSSYYDGSLAIRLGPEADAAEVVWQDRRNMRALMSQPLYRAGHVYLLDKRHGLTCFELASGSKLWDDDNRLTPKGRNAQATLVWTGDDDRAIVLNSDGDLVLIRLSPAGYRELARANIIGPTWAHPGYAGNCVYARSDSEIVCVLLPTAER